MKKIKQIFLEVESPTLSVKVAFFKNCICIDHKLGNITHFLLQEDEKIGTKWVNLLGPGVYKNVTHT